MSFILAIDPGVTGALALYDPLVPDRVGIYDMPVVDGDVNPHRLADIVGRYEISRAVIERVHPHPREGVSSVWRFASAYTTACVVVKTCNIPLTLVPPGKWKKTMNLRGGPGGKEQSRARAIELFPHCQAHFARKKDHNRAEAALLALLRLGYTREHLMIDYNHHSPSSLNQFAASPALFVLERILGLKQVVGSPAHRGVGVEAGVSYGLINPKAGEKECIEAAYTAYDTVSALSPDERKEKYRGNIPDMVAMALDELRPYGKPTSVQGHITRDFPGLQLPILGYYDFIWEDKGVVVDLKTTERMPSEIKIPHARQVSLYCGDNQEGRLTYTTPKKCATYRLENIREHHRGA